MTDPDEVEARVRADIANHGWHAALIPGEQGTPGWACSIGLHERFDHAELVVFGPELSVVRALLTRLADDVANGRRFADGEEPDDVLEGQRLALRSVDRAWYGPFLGNVAWHYRSEDFPALQCFWPDAAGRLPWEPGADPSCAPLQPRLDLADPAQALDPDLEALLRREGAL